MARKKRVEFSGGEDKKFALRSKKKKSKTRSH